MSLENRMALVAESQYGLLTLRQALRCGATYRMIRRRLASGRLMTVYEGVYRMAGAPQSWRQQLLAAVLAAGPGAVASHRAAAQLWGLDGFTGEIVELSVVRADFHRLGTSIVHRSTDLDRSPSTTRSGIPVSSAARTVLDLGAVVRPWRVERAMECVIGRQLATFAGLRAELDAVGRRGRRGAGVLRGLLDARGVTIGQPESVLEAKMIGLLRAHDVPTPICQYEVRLGERLLGRVDFAYPEQRIAIEVDGYESHASLDTFRSDRVRQNDLVEAGWIVLRFTWDDIRNHPGRVAARILRVLVAQKDRIGQSARQER